MSSPRKLDLKADVKMYLKTFMIRSGLVTLAGLVLLAWLYYWNLLGFHYK